MDYKQEHFKAVISNYGNETLYQALSGEVERRLPTASIKWKRSHGRPSKEVVLQATFMKFDSSQLPSTMDSASTLTSKPLLHIFWTSCLDNDKYKSGVKSHITRWQKVLSENQSADWLIIHVVYQDNTKPNKSKINLPRSSVYDKIKTEFGQKCQDRCIQLWEPDKETLFTKSLESWDALLIQLRSLLLESFGRHLDSFEDRIRVMREKYADPEWPFIDYFVVHEELALIYQSLTLREDALIQYDEVDALLSQFIINCSGRDLPKWLQNYCIAPTNWDGVSLSLQTVDTYKELIKSGNASLIDFRNYLFARQCKLLISMNKKSAIPSRLMEFVYMAVQELKLLKVDVQVGSVACWTVLTCMQLFQIIETVEYKDYEFQSTFAHMYDYMRQKFDYLGHITGLFYNREQMEEERKLSDLLITGFGKYPRKKEMPSSVKLLKAALSSKDAYETLYLEFSNKTIQLMTNLRRLHFGMCVGIDLAKFHLQYGRYNDAETLLEKAWSIYKQQKWESLYTDVLIPLAGCQLKHKLNNRYINSVTLLSCAKCLPFNTRNYYSNELLKLSMDNTIKLPVISTDPVIKIVDIHIKLVKNKGHIGDWVKVTLELRNELTIDLPCRSIYIVLKHSDLSNPKSFSDDSPSSRKASPFDNINSAVNVSLSEEKPKEISKEPLTPSSILKKIKSHKRTWSRNKNIIESKNNSQTNSLTSSPSESRSSSISQSTTSTNSYPDGNTSSAKKALFIDNEENKDIPNGELNVRNDHFIKCSSLQDVDIKSSDVDIKSFDVDVKTFDVDVKTSDIDVNSSDVDVKVSDVDVEVSDVDVKSSDVDVKSSDVDIKSFREEHIDIQFARKNVEKHETKVVAPLESTPVSTSIIASDDGSLGKPLATSSIAEPTNVSVEEGAVDESIPDEDSGKCDHVTSSRTSIMSIDDNIFLEPELEENLDQILLSSDDFILTPGYNSVELKSKITIEGRFVLQCMNCIIGNLTFYKLLTQLPRNTKSFFMVADPPKLVWTTDYLVDYLLTGSKQRLHVTLLNGPGVILDGSIIQISSHSGLNFEHLPTSPIQIYPLERDGAPREDVISAIVHEVNGSSVLLHLPECKPYERVSIYFDVVAPVHSDAGDNRMTQHEINFNCLWLKDLVDSSVKLDCIFYEPFQMDYETSQKGVFVFVKVILCGVNPVPLNFFSPKLTAVSSDKKLFQLLSESNILSVYGIEECCILWKLDCSEMSETYDREKLMCQFEVNFKTKEESGPDVGCFCRPISITYTKCLYTVQVSMATARLKKSQPCAVTVTIKRLFLGSFSYRLFLILNTTKQTWNYTKPYKYHEITFNDGSIESSLVVDISTDQEEGSVATPVFLLAKLNEIEMNKIEDVLECITSFEYGQVDYKHSGQTIFYNEEDIVSEL